MSLLAGYDVVIELSNKLVRDLIVANSSLFDTGSAIFFERAIPVSMEANHEPDGTFCLRVNAVEVDLQTTRPMLIQLFFARAWLETPTTSVDSLDGLIEIPVYYPDVLTKNGDAFLSLDLSGIEPCRVALTLVSKRRAEEQLQGATLSYSDFEAALQETVSGFIRKQPLLLIPLGLSVTSNEGGVFPLKFYQLEAHGVGTEEKPLQALGVFGTLLKTHSYEGVSSFKTVSAIPSGSQMTFSISADIFRRFVFCESVAEVLECAVGDLPTVCGSGDSLGRPRSLYRLNSIDAQLNANAIIIRGDFDTDIGDAEFESAVALMVENAVVISAVRALDVRASRVSYSPAEPPEPHQLDQYEPLIRVLVGAIARKMAEKLSHCVVGGLLGEMPDQVSVVQEQGVCFAYEHKVELARLQRAPVPAC